MNELIRWNSINFIVIIAWENSRHLGTLPLVSPPNDAWETSAEIPYWWRVTTKICVVTRHHDQYGISALVSQTSFGGETSGSVAKCRLFSHAIVITGTFRSGAIFDVCERFVLVLCPCRSNYNGYVFVSAQKPIRIVNIALYYYATDAFFSQIRK